MRPTQKSILPDGLAKALQGLAGRGMLPGQPKPLDLRQIIAEIAKLPPRQIARLDYEIAYAAGLTLYPVYEQLPLKTLLARTWASFCTPEMAPFIFGIGPKANAPQHNAEVAYLFLFHRNGRLRERALDMLHDGITSAFYVVALAYRLNDWVPQVRAAAVRCADRVLPLTDPAIIAEAASSLFDRRMAWQRWGEEAGALDRALSRPDVLDALAADLMGARSGPMASVFRHAIRWEALDRHLDALSAGAFLPQVRAVALQTLIDGAARWPVGWAKEWIDKIYNQYRMVRTYDERPVVRPRSLETLVERGALDRSGAVRKVAATALVNHGETLANREHIIELLAGDKSPAIRERVEYVLRPPGQGPRKA